MDGTGGDDDGGKLCRCHCCHALGPPDTGVVSLIITVIIENIGGGRHQFYSESTRPIIADQLKNGTRKGGRENNG